MDSRRLLLGLLFSATSALPGLASAQLSLPAGDLGMPELPLRPYVGVSVTQDAYRFQAQNVSSVVGLRSQAWPSLGVFGRLGATAGRSDPGAPGSGLAIFPGDTAMGFTYGAGLSWDISKRASATLSWDSHDFRALGGGRESLRSTSLGLQWKY